jgi:hypothetical protein
MKQSWLPSALYSLPFVLYKRLGASVCKRLVRLIDGGFDSLAPLAFAAAPACISDTPIGHSTKPKISIDKSHIKGSRLLLPPALRPSDFLKHKYLTAAFNFIHCDSHTYPPTLPRLRYNI